MHTTFYRGYEIHKDTQNSPCALVYKDGKNIAPIVGDFYGDINGNENSIKKAKVYIDELLKPVPLTPELIREFKREFADLLAKYHVMIGLHCDDDSDLDDVTGEKIVIVDCANDKAIVEASGYWMCKEDVI